MSAFWDNREAEETRRFFIREHERFRAFRRNHWRPEVSPSSPVVRCHVCDGRGVIPSTYIDHHGQMWPDGRVARICQACCGGGVVPRA